MTTEPNESVEDPAYRAVGVIEVDSDEAEVDPLPSSVELGVSEQLLQSFREMGEMLRELEANPDQKQKAIDAFVKDWDADRVENAIIERVRSPRPRPTATNEAA